MKMASIRVIFNVTSRCNLACRHCYASEFTSGSELTTDEAMGVLEEVAKLFGGAKVIFSGGEPLLRSDLPELVSYASRLGLRASLATNGLLLSLDKALELKRLGLEEVSVSLESADKRLHEEVRGEGSYEAALNAVKTCKEAGLRVLIDPCITSLNLAEAPRLVELAWRLGVDGMRVFHYVPIGRGRSWVKEAQLTPQRFATWLLQLYGLQLANPQLPIYTVQAPQYTVLLAKGAKEGVEAARRMLPELSPGCRAALNTIAIKHNGDVTPCPLWSAKLGNVRLEGLREALNSPLAESLKRRAEKVKGRCARCAYVELCGGCRVRAYAAYGDYFAEDPLCSDALYKPREEGLEA